MLLSHSTRTAPPAGTARPDGVESSAAHLLRLCLDLQLDALLLALGALAVPPAAGIPWRRWLGEDVDLACTLAAAALDGGAALPPTLGPDLAHAMPATTIDDLVARYASMLGLLEDLCSRTEGGGRPPGLDDALEQCRERLEELRRHRVLATPPTGLDLRTEHEFLPGELLG